MQGHDVSTSHATKIYKTYGNESIQVVQENPYRLVDDIWGIGFQTTDTIASKMGFCHDKYPRLRSGLLYTLNQLGDEGHCYATTIHKAQGSEYPIVVMPVLMTHYVMLQRNLIYTGITRAKKGLVIVGTKKALAIAVRTVTVTKRSTKLERLQGVKQE